MFLVVYIEASASRFRRGNNQEKGYQFEACRPYYLTKIDVLLTPLVPESTFTQRLLYQLKDRILASSLSFKERESVCVKDG
jgi:hypothetical protein